MDDSAVHLSGGGTDGDGLRGSKPHVQDALPQDTSGRLGPIEFGDNFKQR